MNPAKVFRSPKTSVGGVRAKVPLQCADDSPAVVEWAGQPGLVMVRKMIEIWIPFGVNEMKTHLGVRQPRRAIARYRTKTMWWDRRTIVKHCEPEQVSKALGETRAISTRLAAS